MPAGLGEDRLVGHRRLSWAVSPRVAIGVAGGRGAGKGLSGRRRGARTHPASPVGRAAATAGTVLPFTVGVYDGMGPLRPALNDPPTGSRRLWADHRHRARGLRARPSRRSPSASGSPASHPRLVPGLRRQTSPPPPAGRGAARGGAPPSCALAALGGSPAALVRAQPPAPTKDPQRSRSARGCSGLRGPSRSSSASSSTVPALRAPGVAGPGVWEGGAKRPPSIPPSTPILRPADHPEPVSPSASASNPTRGRASPPRCSPLHPRPAEGVSHGGVSPSRRAPRRPAPARPGPCFSSYEGERAVLEDQNHYRQALVAQPVPSLPPLAQRHFRGRRRPITAIAGGRPGKKTGRGGRAISQRLGGPHRAPAGGLGISAQRARRVPPALGEERIRCAPDIDRHRRSLSRRRASAQVFSLSCGQSPAYSFGAQIYRLGGL